MAAEGSGQGLFVALMLAVAVVGVLLIICRELYQRHQLWRFIAQDENLPDPLEILYRYRVEEIEKSESGGENQ